MGDNYNETWLAPGFRFYPTEEELISFYLQQKLRGGRQDIDRVIPEVYIYNYNPWDLPRLSGERSRTDGQLQEWFFFIPKHEKEAKGGRPNRLTDTGYWKATGSPGYVYSSTEDKVIGVKRTMVFYHGRARSKSASKTEWKMNEFMAVADFPPSLTHPAPPQKGEYTICRIYIKSKCLRAFDRRPPAAPIKRAIIAGARDRPGSSNPQPPRRFIVSSESSSASDDQPANLIIPSQTSNNFDQQNIVMNMEFDELWESMDWITNWNI